MEVKELHRKPKSLGIHSIVHKVFHDKSVKNGERETQTKKLNRIQHVTHVGNEETLM